MGNLLKCEYQLLRFVHLTTTRTHVNMTHTGCGCSIQVEPISLGPMGKRISPDGVRMCSHCFRSIHPDLNRLRVRVEHFVLADIQRIIPEMTKYLIVQDCPIPYGVSMERPNASQD